jgi:hypothetical protein
MLCILLNSPQGAGTWRMRRSVEVLAFHEAKEEVEILFGLYVENRLASGTPNFLGIMHRGNVECFLQPAWPLPLHPAEARNRLSKGVFQEIYGDLFRDIGGRPRQVSTLTAWDGELFLDAEKQVEPIVWPPEELRRGEKTEFGWPFPSEGCSKPLGRYIPFTTWKLGPFIEATSYLITFVLRITGETYRKLVDRDNEFTVDGPERLLSRITYDDLYRLPQEERALWHERLERFRSSLLLMGEGYDVIILHAPYSDAVEPLNGSLAIGQAPKQPPHADRFVTANQGFSMALRYAHQLVHP